MPGKKPKAAYIPSPGKQPKAQPQKSLFPPDASPLWRLGKMDLGGPWCWKKMTMENLEGVWQKLRGYETMTWNSIYQNNSHLIPISRLSKKAKDRLREIKLDDKDEFFSMRVTGRERVFAWRDDGAVYLLWWDPNHEVCPSTKKHT